MKAFAFFAAAGVAALCPILDCSAQSVQPTDSSPPVILPHTTAYAEPAKDAGDYNVPFSVRRHHEEAYCSSQGLVSGSKMFRRCVAEVDAALFDRQFPMR
jgi:hypothetical protein